MRFETLHIVLTGGRGLRPLQTEYVAVRKENCTLEEHDGSLSGHGADF